MNSTLSNNLGFGGHATPGEGARTPVWLVLEPVGQQHSERYYEQMKEVRCPFGADGKAVNARHEACLRFSQAG